MGSILCHIERGRKMNARSAMTPRHDERNPMNKQKAKAILNWLLFATCIAGAAYMGFAATGLTVTERIALAGTSLGGLFVAMGGLLPRLNKAIDDLPGGEPRDPQKGETNLLVAIVLAVVAVFLGVSFGYSGKARADEWQSMGSGVYKSGAWVAHPNFAVSAGQVNVKDALNHGLFSGQAIERVALAGGYGLTYHGEKLTIGAGLYFGTGLSAKTPNAPQANLLITFWDALATGPGVQRVTFPSGTVAWQMLWTVGLNYAAGGTVSKVSPWFDKLLNACVAGAACVL
jgi:hypothetical protein